MTLLLGIDVGTASTKGVLATPDGRVVASAVRRHGMSMPRPGWFEVDAEEVWWGDVVAVARELVAAAAGGAAGPDGAGPGAAGGPGGPAGGPGGAGGPGARGRIAGVCVSGVGPALVLLDAGDRPLRPAILYGIDSRAEEEIAELTARYGEDEVLERCGKRLSTQALGPKLRWVARHEPDVWAAARTWSTSSAFAVARLTGEHVLDHHTASQCDPLYDLRAQDWSAWAPELVDHLPLPRLAWSTQAVGAVTAAAAAETGLPAGVPVAAGTVDAWAEGFGAGARRPGDLMLMYGSTMFFVQQLDALRRHPLLWATSGVEPGSRTIAAGMSTSGTLTQWVQELTGGASFDALVAEAAAVPAGSDGLVLLPYLAGERTPVFDPRARGVVAGLGLQHTRGHLFRAAYEGIAFGIRQVLELLAEAAQPARRVFAVGGGTQGGLWTQVVSDVTGREQVVPAQAVGASYGDALMAAIAVGLVPPETDWAQAGQVVRPDPAVRALYDELYGVYGELYPATRDLQHRLAAVQERRFAQG